MMNRRQYHRPNDVSDYALQSAFIDAPQRYTVIEATTKAGKTTGCLVWLFEQAIEDKKKQKFYWVSPTKAMAREAFYQMKRLIDNPSYYTCNKSELTITIYHGAVIYFKSAFMEDYLYGVDVAAAVIDEATRMKEEAWFAVRTTLTKTRGPVKIIGNVKGVYNWVYKLARQAQAGRPNWAYFKITAADAMAAGVLDAQEVEDARNTLPTPVFLELYYGIPNYNSDNKFCHKFDETKHVGKCEYWPKWPLFLSFDFNYNPMCCSVYQLHNNAIWCLRTFKLPNSSIFDLCDEINKVYPNRTFEVTGDAAGYSHNGIAGNHENCYAVIERKLCVGQIHTPRKNPPLYDNRVRVNAYLEKFKVQIDPEHAVDLISDLKFVEAKPDGTIIKGNRHNPYQQADLLDTFRYFCAHIVAFQLPIPYLDKRGDN